MVGSSWVSNLGDGIGLAACPLLIASQTSDPFLVAMAGLLQRLPWLLFGLYAGVLADRPDRRLLVIAVDHRQDLGDHRSVLFSFVGSAVLLALIWRELAHIAHADEAALDPA